MKFSRAIQLLIWGSMTFFAVACGNYRPIKPWPASLNSFENFSDEQKTTFLKFASDLNTLAGDTIFLTESSPEHFPITVKVVVPPSTNPSRAGYATMTEKGCTIEISDFIMKADKASYQESVFQHELGHCTGLDHVADPNAVMAPATKPYPSYTTQARSVFGLDVARSVKDTFSRFY